MSRVLRSSQGSEKSVGIVASSSSPRKKKSFERLKIDQHCCIHFIYIVSMWLDTTLCVGLMKGFLWTGFEYDTPRFPVCDVKHNCVVINLNRNTHQLSQRFLWYHHKWSSYVYTQSITYFYVSTFSIYFDSPQCE